MTVPIIITMTDPSFDALDATALPVESVILTQNQIQQAIQHSQHTPDWQWQAYLVALAQIGFDQWLQERSPDLAATLRHQCLLEDLASDTLVSLLQVGEYQLCLIPVGSVIEKRVFIPTVLLNSPDITPHLYIVVEVWEEQSCVNIYGHLRRDQLLAHQHTAASSPDAIATNGLLLEWFDSNVDTLLLYLRCLNPEAIASVVGQQPETTNQRVDLVSGSRSIYRSPAINVGYWLRDRLDDIAQELSWVLLPPFAITLRTTATPVEQFDAVTMELLNRGIGIPPQARGAYRDLAWGNVALRLYAITWEENQSLQVPEWSLLLILGAQPGATLPIGTSLTVGDDQHILDQQILTESQRDTYLFTHVIGEQNEQFRVTIDMTNGAVITLPPFRFQPPA